MKIYFTCFILLLIQLFTLSVLCSCFPSLLKGEINETKSLSFMNRTPPYIASTSKWWTAAFTLFLLRYPHSHGLEWRTESSALNRFVLSLLSHNIVYYSNER